MNRSVEIQPINNSVFILSKLNIKRNDTKNPVVAILRDANGVPVNLTGALVDFIMVNYKTTLINRRADIIDASNGKVSFTFNDGETSQADKMKAEFKVTYSDTKVETFPNQGYININIEEDLEGTVSDTNTKLIVIDSGFF